VVTVKKLKLGNWIIQVDVDRTRKFYEEFYKITEECNCTYCLNYDMACPSYSDEIKQLFDELGIIPTKEAEVYHLHEIEPGKHLYGGFYHLVGIILEGKDCSQFVFERNRNQEFVNLTDDFKYGFSNDNALVNEDFPKPIIQLEFEAIIPWVLEVNP
jgi:hypothetical protein